MEGLFLGGSLLAAFVAGAVALFAPCCIVVMFPSFLAAAVRNHRWRLELEGKAELAVKMLCNDLACRMFAHATQLT